MNYANKIVQKSKKSAIFYGQIVNKFAQFKKYAYLCMHI